MGPLAYLKSAIGIATLLVVAGLLAWGTRVDYLRGSYKAQLEKVVVAFVDIGEPKPSFKELPSAVKKLDLDRASYKRERDDALSVVDVQSTSITRLEQEGLEAAQEAAANRKLVAETIRQRNAWIQRARQAETRTERLSAEEELRECEAVLDSLRSRGF